MTTVAERPGARVELRDADISLFRSEDRGKNTITVFKATGLAAA